MSTRQRRRFIAGAVCPECRATDRMVVIGEPPEQRRECIECGFTEKAPQLPHSGEPPGRLQRTQQAQPPHSDDIQGVRILDPRKPSDTSAD